ncbi:MAG: 6-phosphogluconolactonase, partial [Vicinamibacteraceae bacterium]|nr:6-phosphogluconolactonase [Vicinamibacteraceae bacterium]
MVAAPGRGREPSAPEPASVRETAAFIADRLLAAVNRHGRAAIALAGGSTPRRVYEQLAVDPALRDAVPWSATSWFWGDERWVAADHPDNNARMAIEACLKHAPVDPAAVHPMPTGMASPDAAADAYAATLGRHLREIEAIPQFDLLLLGMGTDGHTLSLFPGSPALGEATRHCVAVAAPEMPPRVARLTLTPPLVRAAADVLLLVSGDDKVRALRRFDALATDIDACPIHLLREARGTVT